MKITVVKKEFSDALKIMNKACAVKPATPILSGIYLKASSSCLELQATDYTLGIITKIPANVEVEGETVIVGKKLLEIVQKLSGEVVTISTQENSAEIFSGGSKFSLLIMNAEDFPKIKVEESDEKITLRQFQFKNLVSKTAFAASKDDGRPIFTGVLLKFEGEKLTFAATNTHRLAVATERISAQLNGEFIISAKVLQEIASMIDGADEITLVHSGSKIFFTFGNLLVTTRIIAGVFPPYEKVFPKENEIFATVDVEEFKNALDRVAVIAKETEYQTVNFLFANNELKISARSNEVGKAEENISAEIKCGEMDIGFYFGYWTDVLKVVDAEKITIGMSKELAPVDFQTENFHYVVTPVRRS